MTNPLDLAKTRLQLFGHSASGGGKASPYSYSGLANCFTDIVRREGWAALMKGAGKDNDGDHDCKWWWRRRRWWLSLIRFEPHRRSSLFSNGANKVPRRWFSHPLCFLFPRAFN
jgi:hypothetical protein